jgi:hypothetical protein
MRGSFEVGVAACAGTKIVFRGNASVSREFPQLKVYLQHAKARNA